MEHSKSQAAFAEAKQYIPAASTAPSVPSAASAASRPSLPRAGGQQADRHRRQRYIVMCFPMDRCF